MSQLRAAADKLGTTTTDSGDDMKYLSIARLPIVGVTYADLFREVKVQEAIYEALLKRYEISKVEEVKATPRVRVIDPGKVPARRSSPRLSILGIMCTLFCFVAGVIAIFARSDWDGMDPDNPRKRLGMRILGDLRHAAARMKVGTRKDDISTL